MRYNIGQVLPVSWHVRRVVLGSVILPVGSSDCPAHLGQVGLEPDLAADQRLDGVDLIRHIGGCHSLPFSDSCPVLLTLMVCLCLGSPLLTTKTGHLFGLVDISHTLLYSCTSVGCGLPSIHCPHSSNSQLQLGLLQLSIEVNHLNWICDCNYVPDFIFYIPDKNKQT